MNFKTLRDIKNIRGKKFLVRVDFNVPVDNGRVAENIKIKRSLKTIDYLRRKGGRVFLISHLGRPEGRRALKYSLEPVALELAKLLDECVYFNFAKIPSRDFDESIEDLYDGEVSLLENSRFYPGEEKNSSVWSKALAKNFNYFVNDAFAAAHRAHATTAGVARYLPSFAGFNLIDEVAHLERVRERPKKPLAVIIGGAKISTKIKLIKKYLPSARYIMLGGGLVTNVLKADGCEVGASLIDPAGMADAKGLLRDIGKKIVRPIDVVIGNTKNGKKIRTAVIEKEFPKICKKNEAIYDLGPKTIASYKKHLAGAKTIIWNGPLGWVEKPAFAKATNEIARAIARSRAETYVGGGETLMAIDKLGLIDKYTFVSTGGGAMLEFLEGKKLPGLKSLIKK